MRKTHAILVALSTLSCVSGEVPDLALKKRPIDWPILGGIDTKRAPFALAPGSNTLAQDIRQERLGEWRRRDGFGQSGQDTVQYPGFFSGLLGPGGAFEGSAALWSFYSQSVTDPSTVRWRLGDIVSRDAPFSRPRYPIAESESSTTAFARLGNAAVATTVDVNGTTWFNFIDTSSMASLARPGGAFASVRAVATDTYLSVVTVDGAGSMSVYVYQPSTSVLNVYSGIKAGMNAAPYLDVQWYGGATFTIVCREVGDTVRFIEFNPATGTKATDVALAAVSCASTLSLLADPGASGVRFVATSHTTPTTRILRVSSAGAILTNDQVEAVASTHVTGVASAAGANWDVIYQTTAPTLKVNSKAGGVVAAPVALQGAAGWDGATTIDSQAWYEPGLEAPYEKWHVIVGVHSQNTSDPQDTWIEIALFFGSFSPGLARVTSSPVPLAAAGRNVTPGTLLQVTRMSAGRFAFALPVQIQYEQNASVVVRHFSVDMFDHQYASISSVGTAPIGPPVAFGQTAFIPGPRLSFIDNATGTIRPLGTAVPPRQLSVVPSVAAGLLTPLKQYQYTAVLEELDPDGNGWRSPPAEPTIVNMGAGQNTNTLTFFAYALDSASFPYRLAFFRTQGDGSDFRRIYSQPYLPGATVVYTDLLADAAINKGEFVYTTGEIPTDITPPASYLALSDGRLWYCNREYGTEVGYSKKLRPGRLPEFNNVMIVDGLTDNKGDCTGLLGMDGATIIFKESAVYTATGDGFDDGGGGNNYVVSRIEGALGAIPGSPMISLGNEAYYVSTLGIMRLKQEAEFIGSPVDAFLHQPRINTPETVRAVVYVPKWDEVRFVTNASVLVYNRTFQIWYRFKGALANGSPLAHSFVIGGRQYIVREDGLTFVEGDTDQLTDGASPFEGLLQSQWVTPAGSEGRFRLYMARLLAKRTGGGSSILPRLDIFTNYDDDNPLAFEPVLTVNPEDDTVRLEARPNVRDATVTSFSERVTFPAGDSTWRIERWAAVVGVRDGYQRLGPDSQMKE